MPRPPLPMEPDNSREVPGTAPVSAPNAPQGTFAVEPPALLQRHCDAPESGNGILHEKAESDTTSGLSRPQSMARPPPTSGSISSGQREVGEDHKSVADIDEIRRAVAIIGGNGVRELRVPKAGPQGTISGYFDDADALMKAAAEIHGKAPAVYVSLNPVAPGLLARARITESRQTRRRPPKTKISSAEYGC